MVTGYHGTAISVEPKTKEGLYICNSTDTSIRITKKCAKAGIEACSNLRYSKLNQLYLRNRVKVKLLKIKYPDAICRCSGTYALQLHSHLINQTFRHFTFSVYFNAPVMTEMCEIVSSHNVDLYIRRGKNFFLVARPSHQVITLCFVILYQISVVSPHQLKHTILRGSRAARYLSHALVASMAYPKPHIRSRIW